MVKLSFRGILLSGKRAANIMSLIQLAKLNGHEPEYYTATLRGLKTFGGYFSEVNLLVIPIILAMFKLLKRDPQYMKMLSEQAEGRLKTERK
ncbi:hypothetical protein KDX31_15965 [Amphritea atlantica]|uniref:Uncharacterized protein n=1 Tax=Amphritea atlantica TaxID=355243 RepID=A0ABY5GTS2_9GAMM|nr:hypothetical protein KDX31_15965 [Amphritea atlantica]